MAVKIELPSNVEESLRRTLPNLDEQAKEIFLVALYREGKVTHHEFTSAMGVTRDEADGILKRHDITEDLLTSEEFDEERTTLLIPPKSR